LLLGQGSEAPREFFRIEVREAGLAPANIGVLSYGIGVKPAWLVRTEKLLVGFNESVAAIDLKRLELLSETRLLSLFWEFVECAHSRHVCALCETAVVAVTDFGRILWRMDTDLVTDFAAIGSVLEMKFADAPPLRLDMISGAKLPP